MLAPQSGQIRLRIAEIKLELVSVTTASEAITSLPVVAVLHRRMHRTLSAGPQARFGEGCPVDRAAAPCSDSSMTATESPNALLGTNTSQLTGNIEPQVRSLFSLGPSGKTNPICV